ncbi:MAG: RNA polymerase subunit sigma-24 [Rhodocyclales bacterium GWA2_65_20]|nr:MAG: RNA polymerase subunit sigma-24 [Rhodocyclales bacterium GWA2_65_20]
MNGVEEQPAFEDIAGDLAQPLLHYLERYVGDRGVAEDLRQETLLRIDKGLASFAGRSSLKTWAFSIASRVAADYLRHPDRSRRIVALDDIAEAVDADPAIDERMVVGEMNDCVRKVIDSLPDSYRAALILHDLEGLSAGQTAEICECSLAAAKIRIHRARFRLKAALTAQCEFYRDADRVFRCDRKA